MWYIYNGGAVIKLMSTKKKFWLAGLVLVVVGVVLAKVLPGLYEQGEIKLAVYILGITLALAGLGVIMAGMRSKG